MTRKALTIFAVLFAGISLLAVAVIPHHHHSNGICFHNPHLNHHDDGCTHEENDESDRSGTCILKTNYLLPPASELNRFLCQDHNDKNIFTGSQAILSGNQADIRIPVRKLIFCIHSVSSGSLKHLPSSGLRAPPVI